MKNKLKYLPFLILISLAISSPIIITITGIYYSNTLPPIVKYSIPVPLAYNCTEFKYTISYDLISVTPDVFGLGNPDQHYQVSEYSNASFTGTSRVGSKITLTMYYYGNVTELTSGTNTIIKTDAIYLGSITYDVEITETNNNIIGQLDTGNYLFIIMANIMCIIILGYFALLAYPIINTKTGEEQRCGFQLKILKNY